MNIGEYWQSLWVKKCKYQVCKGLNGIFLAILLQNMSEFVHYLHN